MYSRVSTAVGSMCNQGRSYDFSTCKIFQLFRGMEMNLREIYIQGI